jgi:hypothetical protein
LLLSSVSDFSDFANKVEEHIAAKVKTIEEETSISMLQTKNEAQRDTKEWLQRKRSEWKQELYALEHQEMKVIENEVDQAWSAFKKKTEIAVIEKVRNRLEEQFPTLVECFISWVSQHYQEGLFFLPQAYRPFIDTKRFEVQISRKNAIIFRHGNLYIEYSIERIIEELQGEMAVMLYFEED